MDITHPQIGKLYKVKALVARLHNEQKPREPYLFYRDSIVMLIKIVDINVVNKSKFMLLVDEQVLVTDPITNTTWHEIFTCIS